LSAARQRFIASGDDSAPAKIATVREIRAIEARANRSLMSYERMMQAAGSAAADILPRHCRLYAGTTIVFLVGKGNNGGDGIVMARELARKHKASFRLYLQDRSSLERFWNHSEIPPGFSILCAADDPGHDRLVEWIADCDILVDALFGIGLRLPLRPSAMALLQRVQAALAQRRSSPPRQPLDIARPKHAPLSKRPFVLAVDCPSGIDADSGDAAPETLAADVTVTFIAAKPGQFLFPAAAAVGELQVAGIGLPADWSPLAQVPRVLMDAQLAAGLLPARPISGHKGSFGKVLLALGSSRFIGAIALAGEAAGRSGAGYVTIATTPALIQTIAGTIREPTWLPLPAVDGAIARPAAKPLAQAARGYEALLVGCGIGQHPSTRAFLWQLFTEPGLPPLVIDADALNALSARDDWWRQLPPGSILTPHSGEMARLARLSIASIERERWKIARESAMRWRQVVVLKGAHTIIASPDGHCTVMPFKIDALGTAGTGDILAGIIAGLRAQGISAYDSARLGASIHGLAGHIAQEQVGSSRSVIAGDVLAALGSAMRELESL